MVQHAGKLSVNVQGSGAPLVLLHGWGLNQAIWFPIREQLAQQFTVYTIDLPGFGESTWQRGNENFQHTCARVAEQLISSIGKPFCLVGWSMGGLIATQIALDYPTYVQRLVCVASSPCFVARPDWPEQNASAACAMPPGEWPGIKKETLEAFRYQLTTDFRKTLERFLAVQALGSPAAREEIKTMRALLAERSEPHPDALVAGLRWLAEVDLRSDLRQLHVPSLRIYGRRDSLVPITASEAIAHYLPNNGQHPSVHFGASAHAPFFTEPAMFVEQLQQFLTASE